jgi:hypothetical protein
VWEHSHGAETLAPTSALPIGAARAVGEMQPLLVDPGAARSGLLNATLALLAPPAADEAERYDEEVLDLHVLGFAVVCVPPRVLAGRARALTPVQHGHRRPEPQAHRARAEHGRTGQQDGGRRLARVERGRLTRERSTRERCLGAERRSRRVR